MPLVSIGLPVYNGERTILPAVRSILWQTFTDWELHVADDGSTDRTLELLAGIRDPRVHVHSGKHLGLVGQLNRMIDLSRGTYFARMDADDVAYPQRLERQLLYREKHPGVDLVGAHVLVFDSNGVAEGKRIGWLPEKHEDITRRPYRGIPIMHPTYLGPLSWFRRFRYTEGLRWSEDVDLLLRAYRTSTYANVPEVLLGYREETVLPLKKLLGGRRFLARYLFKELIHLRRPLQALRGLAETGVKAGVEILAAGTGLSHRWLVHRVDPISAGERAEWERLWRDANAPPAG
jgi:glycosyltransferase involved in cell wall biosynthesis